MDLNSIKTEQRNSRTAQIDTMSTLSMVKLINEEDKKVAVAVGDEAEHIAQAVDVIAAQLKQGGRLVYSGCGTSGRLGILDAVECPPTYSTDPGEVIGLIAGGNEAIFRAKEGAEDDEALGAEDLKKIDFGSKDVLVGIAADFQLGIDLPLDALHRIDQFRHVLGSKILCLNRNENIIRCRQSIDDQHTEGRTAIQQNIIIVLFDLIHILPQHRLPAHDIHQTHLNGGQGTVARDEIKALMMVADLRMLIAADTSHDIVHGIAQCQRQIIRFSQSQHFG